MAIYIGLAIIDDSVVAKLNSKHQVTLAELLEAIQWPARVEAAFENHSDHGARWLVWARTSQGRELLAVILPTPAWEGSQADTWVVKTARWV